MAVLYVVATPIGNLNDWSPRAQDTLRKVQLIAAEDTRVTQKLLSAFDIHTPLTSCHEHNERSKSAQIIERMKNENIDVAVTTDAGTPCISDPGSVLTHMAAEAGIEIIAIPGPTAMASALSVSGIEELTEFTFFGFLPRSHSELREKLLDMSRHTAVAVVHESPHRVVELLESLEEVLPKTYVSASCDLTKKYEKTIRGNVSGVLEQLKQNPKTEKGEYCLVFRFDETEKPEPMQQPSELSIEAQLFDRLVRGLTMREAMAELQTKGIRKNLLYAASLKVKKIMCEEAVDE